MKFGLFYAAVVSGLTIATSQRVVDSFVLSQCECPEAEFFSLEENFFQSFQLRDGEDDIIQCNGEGEFPSAPGFRTVYSNDVESSGLSSSGLGSFFFENGLRSVWHVIVSITPFVADGASVKLLKIESGGVHVLTVDLNTTDFGGGNFFLGMRVVYGSGERVNSSSLATMQAGQKYNLVFGEGFIAEDSDARFFMAEFEESSVRSSIEVRSIVLPELLPLNASDEVVVEMFSRASPNEGLNLQVDGFQFGRGPFPGMLELDLDLVQDIFSSLPFPSPSIPSVAQVDAEREPEFQVFQGESILVDVRNLLIVDVRNLLIGRDIDIDDLEIVIERGELNGTFQEELVTNPFVYTPPDDFVGNQTFFFSYGISQPYECVNANIPAIISVTKRVTLAPTSASASMGGSQVSLILFLGVVVLAIGSMVG